MKQKLFSVLTACCLSFVLSGTIIANAATVTSNTKKANYALWRQSAIYDDGMFRNYVSELLYGADAPKDYFLSTKLPLSEQDTWYDSDQQLDENERLELYVNIPSTETAMFYTKSPEDIEAATTILTKYYPDNSRKRNLFYNRENCFYLTDSNSSSLDLIRQDLNDAGLLACFYNYVPVYQHCKLSTAYLTSYLPSQYYSSDPSKQLTEDYLQTYIDEQELPCTLKTEEGRIGTSFYIIPNNKISFQEHWNLALKLYHDLGIVPNMLPDQMSQESVDPPTGAGIPYDVNADAKINIDDVMMLRDYLFSAGELIDPKASDINQDNKINAIDLTLLKRYLLEQVQTSDKELIDPPIRALEPSLPSVGEIRVPVFAVNFPDCNFTAEEVVEKLKKSCFSVPNSADPAYPHESIAAYFERASYGRLKLTGDVFQYTAEHPIDWYAEDDARQLVDEIMATFDTQIDYTEYDIDRNQVLDSLVIALPENALQFDNDKDGKPDWWPFSTSTTSGTLYDGIKTGKYCSIVFDSMDYGDFNQKTAHELCHAMGLPDYYRYYSDSSENEGLIGEAGYELMDEGLGDLSSCSKLLLGWLAKDEIQVYTGGSQTFYLDSFSDVPSCVIIPKDSDNGYLSEYFLIEYVTPEANQPEYINNGIRILHVQAEVSEGKHGTELTYNNYGLHYDKSEQKQRVLRLVNDNGYLYPGKKGANYMNIIDNTVDGFHWYDEDGNLTEDTGLTIKIGDIHSKAFYNPSDPTKWINGICQITITDSE